MWTGNEEGSKKEASTEMKNKYSDNQKATIGPSVSIKGEISGEEDILIEGSVEGSINLPKNAVTVAESGKVKANIYAVTIHVTGEVTGDLNASERIVVHRTGRVIGNITAGSISLEEGGRIKGMVDTDSAHSSAAPLKSHVSYEASSSGKDNSASFGKGHSKGGKSDALTSTESA